MQDGGTPEDILFDKHLVDFVREMLLPREACVMWEQYMKKRSKVEIPGRISQSTRLQEFALKMYTCIMAEMLPADVTHRNSKDPTRVRF